MVTVYFKERYYQNVQENENEMTKEGLTRAKLTGKCQVPNTSQESDYPGQ